VYMWLCMYLCICVYEDVFVYLDLAQGVANQKGSKSVGRDKSGESKSVGGGESGGSKSVGGGESGGWQEAASDVEPFTSWYLMLNMSPRCATSPQFARSCLSFVKCLSCEEMEAIVTYTAVLVPSKMVHADYMLSTTM
jgi:hypothetical protein